MEKQTELLQIRVSPKVKRWLEFGAKERGWSTVSEYVRVIMRNDVHNVILEKAEPIWTGRALAAVRLPESWSQLPRDDMWEAVPEHLRSQLAGEIRKQAHIAINEISAELDFPFDHDDVAKDLDVNFK